MHRLSSILVCGVSLAIVAVQGTFGAGNDEVDVSHPPRAAQEERKPTPEDYERLFRLEDGEVVKRVSTPFPASRMVYYQKRHAGQAAAIPRGPDNIFFRWTDGKVRNWGMSFGGGKGTSLPTILRLLANVYPQEFVGDDDVMEMNIPGDFVVDDSAPRERIINELQQVLNEQLKLDLTIASIEIEREVYVAQGEYSFVPINPQRNQVEIYGDELNRDPSIGGGGSGDFDEFIDWVGMWIGETVVSDVKMPPVHRISWHYNLQGPFTEEQRRRAKDPERVLKNVTMQTGLVFVKERRKVHSVVIERN